MACSELGTKGTIVLKTSCNRTDICWIERGVTAFKAKACMWAETHTIWLLSLVGKAAGC